MEKLEGSWKFESIENSEAIEKAMALPEGAMKAETILAMSPILLFKFENNSFTVETSCGQPMSKFAVGEEQTMACPIARGTKKQTTFSFKDGAFYEHHKFGNGREVMVEKVIDGDTQFVKFKSEGNTVGTAIYKRV